MTFLCATGSYLPARVVRNEQIARQVGVSAEWLFNVSGIRERRIANAHETVERMAVEAAHRCLHDAHLRASHAPIGALLLSTGSGDRRFPGPAAAVAAELGLHCVAIDLPVASAGSIFAVALGALLTERLGNVLVVASERMSHFALREPLQRGIAPLFGDGAGACLLRSEKGFAQVVASAIHSDGKFANDLSLDCQGTFTMRGRSVIQQSTKRISEVIREVLEKGAAAPGEVAAYILHQANLHIIQRIAEVLGTARERFFCNLERYGNTSSASMLIALDEWRGLHQLGADELLVLAGFGAGYHWGAALLRGC